MGISSAVQRYSALKTHTQDSGNGPKAKHPELKPTTTPLGEKGYGPSWPFRRSKELISVCGYPIRTYYAKTAHTTAKIRTELPNISTQHPKKLSFLAQDVLIGWAHSYMCVSL